MGNNIVRLQIPIFTNEHSFIVVLKEGMGLAPLARILADFEGREDDVEYNFDRFYATFGERFDLFQFPPGYLYRFDTDRIHTAINAGDQERIVLCVDLMRNDWVDRWLGDNLTTPVLPSHRSELPEEARWNWNSLKHGLLSHPRIEIA